MLLFRRRPRDKDGPAEDPPGSTDAPPAPTPSRSARAETPPPRAPSASVEAPPAPPPPLPQRVPGTGTEAPPLAPLSRCFVCGSLLEAGRCPTCRIAWVE